MWNGWRHVSVFLLSAPHLQSHHHPLFNHQRNHVSRTFTYCQSFLSRFKVFSLPAMFTPATQGVLVHWWYNKESYLAKACLSLSLSSWRHSVAYFSSHMFPPVGTCWSGYQQQREGLSLSDAALSSNRTTNVVKQNTDLNVFWDVAPSSLVLI